MDKPKYTPTGVILDDKEAAFILSALKDKNYRKECYKRVMKVAVENGLDKFEITEKKYYSFNERLEILLVEVNE